MGVLVTLWEAHPIQVLIALAVLIVTVFRVWSKRQKQSIVLPQPAFSRAPREKEAFPQAVAHTVEKRPSIPPVSQIPNSALREPKRIQGSKTLRGTSLRNKESSSAVRTRVQPVIFYYSLGGSTAKLAKDLQTSFLESGSHGVEVHDIAEIDFDAFFVSPKAENVSVQLLYILLLPTYNIDSELDTFIQSLEETHNDFRIDTAPLRDIAGYAVFGLGDKEGWPTEPQGYCSQAKDVDKWMSRLSAGKRAYPIGMGDVKAGAAQSVHEWGDGLRDVMAGIMAGKGLGEGVPGSGDAVESDEDVSSAEESDASDSAPRTSRKRKRRSPTTDLEDIRAPPAAAALETDFTTTSTYIAPPKEMVPKTSTTYTALTKQGYTIVGTHSGVKTCRWTKSALRGRGSCYKYSFYGIASHRCMEATPSLSCSNKCVFCWRHGTNPVSTTWRWTVDPADLVFAGIKAGHYSKIKQLRGVPGVRAERFTEALTIRHCALSLVGEPIFYPHINELLSMLHGERISSFLVCNAQHPAQLRALAKVTQLYVSIDAPTRDRLKKTDRPLHRDFWERFLECMDILRERRLEQRTVFRLTLVKGFNLDDEEGREDVRGYADLVERARPGLIEVKGVTYCGTSTGAAAGLTMQNVPFYEEVCSFVEALDKELERRGLGYGIAAEHAHSCCILLGEKERFYKKDGWHTLIDYEAFFERLESGDDFGPADYVGEKTPEWALYGNGGFDPRDQRVDRKGRIIEDTVDVRRGVKMAESRVVEI